MNRLLIAVAVAASVAAFNVEAQQNLGNAKNPGAFRTTKYQVSGALKIYPTAGQRHNIRINSGQYRMRTNGSRKKINRKLIKN